MGEFHDRDDHDFDPRLAELITEKVPGMFPTQAVLVVGYIDEDGDERWSSHTWGNGRTSGLIGLLEYAKRWLIDDMLSNQNQDDD